jgi:hypothetical protein
MIPSLRKAMHGVKEHEVLVNYCWEMTSRSHVAVRSCCIYRHIDSSALKMEAYLFGSVSNPPTRHYSVIIHKIKIRSFMALEISNFIKFCDFFRY